MSFGGGVDCSVPTVANADVTRTSLSPSHDPRCHHTAVTDAVRQLFVHACYKGGVHSKVDYQEHGPTESPNTCNARIVETESITGRDSPRPRRSSPLSVGGCRDGGTKRECQRDKCGIF